MSPEEQIGGVNDPVPDYIRKELEAALLRQEGSNQNVSSLGMMKLSDKFFRTYGDIVKILTDTRKLTQVVTLPQVEEVKEGEDIVEHEVEVYLSRIIALIASAHVAVDLHDGKESSVKNDPVKLGLAVSDTLLKDIDPTQQKIPLHDLITKNESWIGALPLLNEPEVIDTLESIPKVVMESDASFTIYEQKTVSEIDRIKNIVAAFLKRLSQQSSEESNSIRNQMRNWRRWEGHISNVTVDSMDLIRSIYNKTIIKPELLLNLASGFPSLQSAAKEEIEEGGGFLHGFDEETAGAMLQHGHTKVVCKDKGDINTAFGYYSVIADEINVKSQMSEICGYEDGILYTENNLPTESTSGMKMYWFNPDRAAAFLNTLKSTALAVELAIIPEEGRYAAATALKEAVTSEILEDEGKSVIFTRYFQIQKVNGVKIQPLTNLPSSVFIHDLGGYLIGGAKESFQVEVHGGLIELEVMWHLVVTDGNDVQKKIHAKKPASK